MKGAEQMRNKRTITLIFIALLFVGCATVPKPYRISTEFNPDAIQRVGIIPGEFQLLRLTAARSERYIEGEDQIRSMIMEDIQNFLKTNSISSVNLEPDSIELEQTPELARDIQMMREDFVRAIKEISKRKYSKKDPYLNTTITPDIGQFAEISDSEYILFFSGNGWNRTSGSIAKSVVKSVIVGVLSGGNYMLIPKSYGLSLSFALVNAKSLKVVWYSSKTEELNPEEPKHINRTVNSLFKNLLPVAVSTEGQIPANTQLSIYTSDRGTVYGTLREYKSGILVVETRKGDIVEVPMSVINSVQDAHNRKVYYER